MTIGQLLHKIEEQAAVSGYDAPVFPKAAKAGICDCCDKEIATHFVRAEMASPVYCDTNACCACSNCDEDSRADHEEELIDSADWGSPNAPLSLSPEWQRVADRYYARATS